VHRLHATLLLSIPTPLIYTGHFVFAAFDQVCDCLFYRAIVLAWDSDFSFSAGYAPRMFEGYIPSGVEAAINRAVECVINTTGSADSD
jgi:hypothetical protein